MARESLHSICRWTFNPGKGGFVPGDMRPEWGGGFGTAEMIELVAKRIRPRLPKHVVLGIEMHYDAEVDDMALLRLLARHASAHALELNPASSDAWMGRAYELYIFYASAPAVGDDSVLAALAAFRRAVDLNARNDEAWHQYGSVVRLVSDSASIDALHRALALDPNRAITYQDLSVTYFTMGRTDLALAAIDSALALDPDGPFRGIRVLYRLTTGDTAGALADARIVRQALYAPPILAILAHDTAAARAMEATVAQRACGNSAWMVTGYWLFETGRQEQVVRQLLECGPSLQVRWVLRFPFFAPLRQDPRLEALRDSTDRILARARWR